MRTPKFWILLALLFAVTPSIAQAATVGFDLELEFGVSLSSQQQLAFQEAELLWESLITGYQDTVASTQLVIRIEEETSDGVGGVLATGMPTGGRIGLEANFLYSSAGTLRFDLADTGPLLSIGLLDDVVAHEIGHAIGFGTLWSNTGIFQELYVPSSGQYTGEHALAAYRRDFDAHATFVPVELDGGPGTADAHWEEDIFGDEIMTGFLDGPVYVSSVTRGGLVDLGYTVTAVPEPSMVRLVWCVLGSILGRRVMRRVAFKQT